MAREYFVTSEIKGYKLISRVGRGSYGQVFKAMEEATRQQVAIKFLLPDKTSLSKRERELRVMQKMGNHPNVIGLRAVVRDQDNCPHAVMDLMQEGSLRDLVRNQMLAQRTGFTDEYVGFLGKQVLRGIEHIHSCGILHRDIKPDNILVSKHMELKIADFGLAVDRPSYSKGSRVESDWGNTSAIGTMHYMAPEVLMGQKVYDAPADMWSFGCILAELFLGDALYDRMSRILLDQVTGKLLSTERLKKELADAMPRASASAIDLMSKLLNFYADQRPTAKEALEHPFFSPVKQQELRRQQTKGDMLEEYKRLKLQLEELERLQAQGKMPERDYQQFKLQLGWQHAQRKILEEKLKQHEQLERQQTNDKKLEEADSSSPGTTKSKDNMLEEEPKQHKQFKSQQNEQEQVNEQFEEQKLKQEKFNLQQEKLKLQQLKLPQEELNLPQEKIKLPQEKRNLLKRYRVF